MVREGVEGFTLGTAELPESLAPLLARLSANVELCERMGEAARNRVAREFSLQTMVAGYASLIGANADPGLRLNERPS